VQVPDVTTIGEGYTSWADYVGQREHDEATSGDRPPRRPALDGLLRRRRRSLALGLLTGHFAAAAYLLFGITPAELDAAMSFTLWGADLASSSLLWLWLRRYRVAGDEETGGETPATSAPTGSAEGRAC
jgi:hypothetical protein